MVMVTLTPEGKRRKVRASEKERNQRKQNFSSRRKDKGSFGNLERGKKAKEMIDQTLLGKTFF